MDREQWKCEECPVSGCCGKDSNGQCYLEESIPYDNTVIPYNEFRLPSKGIIPQEEIDKLDKAINNKFKEYYKSISKRV